MTKAGTGGAAGGGPNPRRVQAGRANRAQRGPLTEAGRERLRQAALRQQPWQQATGPRSAAGKAQAVRNGKRRQKGPRSVRELRAELAGVRSLIQAMRQARQQVKGQRLCPLSGNPQSPTGFL